MRARLAVLLAFSLAAAAAPAAAAPKPDPLDWLWGPVAPHFIVNDMDDRGLPRYPYDPVNDIKNGAGSQWWTRAAHQWTEGKREAAHYSGGFRLLERYGALFDFTHFQSDAFKSQSRPDFVTLHGTADLSTSDDLLFEYGFGVTSLWADRTYFGVSASFSAEKRLVKPLSLELRYIPAILAHTSPLHDLSAGLAANWRYVGVEAGYRALLNGLRHVYGPEVAFRLWL